MKLASRATLLLALLLSATLTPAQESSEQITAQGVGFGANQAEALMNAKRDAIEKGIGTILLSQTEVENFMVQRDQIITKTMGAVKSYDVISQTTSTDGLIEIAIKAILSRSAMREDLAAFHILIESMNKPRVMVIIAENNVGNQEPTNSSAETAIIKFLRDPYEFELVDPQVTATIKQSQQKMASLSDNPAEAAAFGAQYGAEVLIIGTAISREATGISANLGGMVSVQANVALKVINCTNARIMGASDGHGAKVHISPNTAGNQAIAQAANKAVKQLLDVIIKEWQGQLNNGIPITVQIRNVSTFSKKKDILATFSSISAITATRERSWDGTSGLLTLDIQYKGNVDGFCSRLDGYKMKSGSGSLGVNAMSGSSVTLVLQAM